MVACVIIVSYKCVGNYNKGNDSDIIWNDDGLAIDWNVQNPIILKRDSELVTFDDFVNDFKTL